MKSIHFPSLLVVGLIPLVVAGCQTGRSAASRIRIYEPESGREVAVELPKDADNADLDAHLIVRPDGTKEFTMKASKFKTDASGPITAAGDANAKALQQGAAIGAAVMDAAMKSH